MIASKDWRRDLMGFTSNLTLDETQPPCKRCGAGPGHGADALHLRSTRLTTCGGAVRRRRKVLSYKLHGNRYVAYVLARIGGRMGRGARSPSTAPERGCAAGLRFVLKLAQKEGVAGHGRGRLGEARAITRESRSRSPTNFNGGFGMSHSKTLVGIIVLGMSLGASGCANWSFSSAKMCTAHGGNWNAAAATCNGLSAQSVCEQAIGGRYNGGPQTCEM